MCLAVDVVLEEVHRGKDTVHQALVHPRHCMALRRFIPKFVLLVTCIGPCARMTRTSLEDGLVLTINYATDCGSRMRQSP